jgi:hypothetical protein
MCPIRFLLALALADEALDDHNTLGTFERRFIRETANSKCFPIRKDKKNLPILRKVEGNQISSTKIWTASSLVTFLKSLGERCGYQDPVSCYAFRRGFANRIEGNIPKSSIRYES